jgi:nitrite reductase/ring-hydroxylating ferredoxin subunit
VSQNGWHKVDPADVPDDGRVRSVVVDGRAVALSRCGARLGALENRCPHQGVRGERLRGADRASSGLFRDGRGVAHLVLPDEVQVQPSTAPAQRPDGRFSDRRIRPDDAALSQAAALVRDARRPVIIVGHGARGAASEVRLLAERLNARC